MARGYFVTLNHSQLNLCKNTATENKKILHSSHFLSQAAQQAMTFEVMKVSLCYAPHHTPIQYGILSFMARGHFVACHHSQLNLHQKTALALNKILHSSQFF
jgi:hypothetical protein